MRLFGIEIGTGARLDRMQETITSLSRQLEDVGWVNLGNPQHGSQQYLPGTLFEVITLCRRLWINAPLAGHWERLLTAFVFGHGISVPKAADAKAQDIIDAFWEDPDNQATLTSAQAQWQLSAKAEYEGNLFFVLLRNPATGQVKVRIADTATITDVICAPEDQTRRLFYRRNLVQRGYDFRSDAYAVSTPKVLYYPDLSVAEPDAFPVPPEKLVPNAAILHARLNCDLNDKYGIPPMLRGLDWIRTHKAMANDMANLISALARFAWNKKIKGSPAQVAGAKALLQAKSDRSNPAPTAGATFIGNMGVDLDPVNVPTGGAIIHREGLRAMVLQVAAAAGFGEQYFGDPSTGNLATAKVMELPLLKSMQMRQQFWISVYDAILQYVLDQAIDAGLLPGSIELLPQENRWKVTAGFDRDIDIDFPPLVEEDLKPTAEALQIAKDAGLIDAEEAARQFLMARHVNDVEAHLDAIKSEEAQRTADAKAAADAAAKAAQTANPDGTPKPGPNGNRLPAATKEAIELPSRAQATSMADKSARVLGKLEGYRRELGRAYRVFGRRVKERLELVGPEGAQRARIRDLKDALTRLTDDMQHAAALFFPQAIDLGRAYVRAHLTDAQLQEGQAKGLESWLKEAGTEAQLTAALRWNRQYLEDSLVPDLAAGLDSIGDEPLTSGALANDLLAEKLGSFEARVGMYASAFWAVEEAAVADVGAEYGMKVNFVGADDGGTCESCQRGLEGNPWPIQEAPRPGFDTVCRTNCRHALQIVENPAVSQGAAA